MSQPELRQSAVAGVTALFGLTAAISLVLVACICIVDVVVRGGLPAMAGPPRRRRQDGAGGAHGGLARYIWRGHPLKRQPLAPSRAAHLSAWLQINLLDHSGLTLLVQPAQPWPTVGVDTS
jgi:hypothetical protein